MSNVLRNFVAVGLLAGWVGLPTTADAAEFTDVLDAADDKDDYAEETYDPFDFNLEPSFSYETGTAQITREAPCVARQRGNYNPPYQQSQTKMNPRTVFDPARCKEAGATDQRPHGILENREMKYRHREMRLEIDARVGLFKDLELRFNAPFVLREANALKYADGVNPGTSWVDPNDTRIQGNAQKVFGNTSNKSQAKNRIGLYQTNRFFELSNNFADNEYTRAGFDDPSVGLSWGAFNDQRDDTKATLMLAMDYTIPVATIRKPGNRDAVGDGLHKLKWTVGSSKQFDWVEPYFGLSYMLQLPAQGSPIIQLKNIDSDNEGQSITNPPHVGRFQIGTEFIPYEKRTEDDYRRYAIDLNFTFGYNSVGRTYNPLYDHMVRSDCNGKSMGDVLPNYENGSYDGAGNVQCAWLAERPANVQGGPTYDPSQISNDTTLRTNGIMTVGSHATFAGHVGLYMQPTKYFQFKILGGITHESEHYLTDALVGNDQENDNNSSVDLNGQQAEIERNPAYNAAYDAPGTRFRVNRYNIFSIGVTAALQF